MKINFWGTTYILQKLEVFFESQKLKSGGGSLKPWDEKVLKFHYYWKWKGGKATSQNFTPDHYYLFYVMFYVRQNTRHT